MITTDEFAGAELFNRDGVMKNIYINYDGGVITNEDIHFESLELTESICSDAKLTFGSCEASSIKFKCSNVGANLKGKTITVDVSLVDGGMNDPRKSGIYTARLSSSTLTKVVYVLEYADYLLSSGVGTYYIILRFDKLPEYSSTATVYLRIKNIDVPIENGYFREGYYVTANEISNNINYKVTVSCFEIAGGTQSYAAVLTGRITEDRLRIGTYVVENVKKLNEKRWLEVTAYDVMKKILEADVTEWYDSIEFGTISVVGFRRMFFEHLGIQQETTTLANDGIIMTKKAIDTNEGTTRVSGADIIRAICEVNGVFGHIGRDGIFHYKKLDVGVYTLYPADDIYPDDDTIYPNSRFASINYAKNSYITANYEDFYTAPIDGIKVVDTEHGRKIYTADSTNTYTITDNLIVNSTYVEPGERGDPIATIARNILDVIKGISYRPVEVKNLGNPCYEVGDVIVFMTKYALIESYILQRRLTGIQAMRDNITADGIEYYT